MQTGDRQSIPLPTGQRSIPIHRSDRNFYRDEGMFSDNRGGKTHLWEVLKAASLDYIYSLDQTQLDEIILWELPARGKSSRNRRWEILLHVANHGTDHRAQILAMLRQHFGVPTVEQDMIFYLLGL